MSDRYYVRLTGVNDWTEVSLHQFCAYEHAAGFHPKPGCGPTATAGFSSGGVVGKVVYEDTPPAATKPASTRDLTTVIDNMLAVIPPEETQANASLVIGLLSIRDSALFAPPEGTNLHWRRVLDVFGDAFGSEPRPGWPTKMCEIFRGGPIRREHLPPPPPSPMPGHATTSPSEIPYDEQVMQEEHDIRRREKRENRVQRSMQRMQIEQQTIYAHFRLRFPVDNVDGWGLPRRHTDGYLTIVVLRDNTSLLRLTARDVLPNRFFYGLSICAPGDQFHRDCGRTESLRRLIAYLRHGTEGTRYPTAGEVRDATQLPVPQGILLHNIVTSHLNHCRNLNKRSPKWLMQATVAGRV